jgi:protein-tyrosine phosphatase
MSQISKNTNTDLGKWYVYNLILGSTKETLSKTLQKIIQFDLENNGVCEILENLYIGTMTSPYSKFAVVIQVCDEEQVLEKINYFKNLGGEYYNFPIDEENERTYLTYIEKIIELIDKSRKAGKKVLVHCYAGLNRSVCVCAEYVTRFGYFTLRGYLCELFKNDWKFAPTEWFFNRMKTFRI